MLIASTWSCVTYTSVRPRSRLQPLQLGAHLESQQRVECRDRLVEQVGLGVADDRAAERDALPLAAGQLGRLALEQVLDMEHLRRLGDPPLDLVLGNLALLEREREVVEDGLVGVEREVLEDDRDVAVTRPDCP